MGMYSFFDFEEIEVIDWKGLVTFIKLWRKEIPLSWIGDKDYKMIDIKGKSFSFEKWDNIKLISYWYDDEVVFLNCIAKYIEGRVDWRFENNDEGGYVKFTDGKCFITTGNMIWTTYNPKDLFRGKPLNEGVEGEIKEAEKLKSLMVLNNL